MDTTKSIAELSEPEETSLRVEAEAAKALAWEMIEPGRFKPRRIRGSFHGADLG
jgi:hypothetical protein